MKGCFTAIVTPFKDGAVDYPSLAKLIVTQAEAGITGIVPCGTTGESPTLSHEEHDQIVEFVIKEAKRNQLKVIAGTGSNSTAECLRLSKHAEAAGADGILVVSPYYNKPTQQGLYQHYKTIAEAVRCELVIYNIPGRTSVNIAIETFKSLSALKNFNTVKEATGSVDYASSLLSNVPSLDLLSGNDSLNLPLASIGGVGCISVLSNIFPAAVKRLFTLHTAGNPQAAAKLHYQLLPIVETLFLETNPIPVKTACLMRGLIATAEVRMPLLSTSSDVRKRLEEVLAAAGEL